MSNDKFIKSWARQRKKGKTVYSLTFGGIMSASCLTGDIIFYLLTDIISIESVLGSIIGGLIGGAIGGILRWNTNEEKYKNERL